MRTMRIALACLVVAAACATLVTHAAAQQNPDRLTVNFSDPSKPGTVRVHVMAGSITVKGANRKDVLIETRNRSNPAPRPQGDAPPGLRRLTQPGGFGVEEENNELSIVSRFGRGIDFEIHVPTRTNVKLSTINGGEVVVDAVEGEVEVNNTHGAITLTNIAGSVMANSVNGAVKATLIRVTPDKAMAFTSMNGAVDVTLPSSIKANLKLRSDRGDVFTDFDVQVRAVTPTRVEDSPRGRRVERRGTFRIDVNGAIYGTVNGGGQEFELRTFNGSVYVRKGAS